MELKELIYSLSSVMTISGFGLRNVGEVESLIGEHFDESYRDGVGNIVFIKRSKRPIADGERRAKILIDAHLDEIGMIVTDILDGGFLTVTNIGGIDPALLQASDVCIYGKEKIFGVISSTPPHLSGPDDRNKHKNIEALYIDTGYKKEDLEKLVRLGTPVGFAPVYKELMNMKMSGKSFDDKACAACAAYAIANTPAEELYGDVYLLLSNFEETSAHGGVTPGTYNVMPDYAMVIDVNLAAVPDTKKTETVEMNEGPSITYSTSTDRRLTRMLEKACKASEIPLQISLSPSYTGTNAVSLQLVGNGIPTVDIGLPLAFMHSPTEMISLKDCEALVKVVETFIKDESIGREYGYEE